MGFKVTSTPNHPGIPWNTHWASPPLLGREMPPALGPAVTLGRERQVRAGPAQQLPLLWATQQSWDLTKLGSSSLGMIFCRDLWGDGKGAHQQMWGSSPCSHQPGCNFQLSREAIPALVTGKGRILGVTSENNLSSSPTQTHTAWAPREP